MTGFLGRDRGTALLLTFLTLAPACVSTAPPPRSTLQEKIGQGSMSATELRLRLYELPGQYGAVIETAADQIREKSSDPAVRRRALLWKADGIPALFAAALRPDPLAGCIDLWLFLEQMDLYFREGAGKNAFGAQQALATAATARMLASFEETYISLTPDKGAFERRQTRIREFARSHPIEGPFSSRDTALIELASLSQGESGGALASVREATETLEDVSLRLNAYVTLVPKVGRWQADLAAEDITGRADVRGTLEDLQAVGQAARRADRLLADIPGAAREASVPIQELLDRQGTELLAQIDRERLAMTAFVTAEREAALGSLTEERKAALATIGQERAAVQAGLDALAKRSIEDASGRARGEANHIFVLALILLVAAAILFAAAYRFARRGQT